MEGCLKVTYWTWVSDLQRMVRMKEAVSLGPKVEGTTRYSPGFSITNSITSRAFTNVLVWATGLFLRKKEAGNFPLCPLYCNTNIKYTFHFSAAHIDLHSSRVLLSMYCV